MDTLWQYDNVIHLKQDDTGHNIAKVGFNGFHFWIPFLGSTPQNVAETWGFSYIAATLTGLPQLMDVPNVLRGFGLLLIGLRRASSNSNGNSLRQILPMSGTTAGESFNKLIPGGTGRWFGPLQSATWPWTAMNSPHQVVDFLRPWSWMNFGWI